MLKARCTSSFAAKNVDVVCRAGKGAKYYENFKRNRAPHEGVLLSRPPGIVSLLPLNPLLEYLEQEVWAYTIGQPSPTQALAGRPLGAKPSVQELLAEEEIEWAVGMHVGGTSPLSSIAQRHGKAGRPGTIVPPPAALQGPGMHPLPPFKGRPYHWEQAQVHVFWDVEAHHPGTSDPRILVHRIRSFALGYGQVAGIYAYAVRKTYNWVPEAFVRQARYVSQGVGEPGGVWADRVSSEDASNDKHKAASGSTGGFSSYGKSSSSSLASRSMSGGKTVANNSIDGVSGDYEGGVNRWAVRNTSRRTLGRVLLYHNSLGQALVPPVGHQLSLKYSLMQEGVETRVVQNSSESVSNAVINGMNRLLDKMRRGEVDTGMQTVVIVISDDEERIQKPLLRLRGIGGAATVAVCIKGDTSSSQESSSISSGLPKHAARYRGADCIASWSLLASGLYAHPVNN